MTRSLKRISYVEDDHDIRELTELTLSSIGGFEVAVFESGPAAIAGIPSFKPDLVLLDVMMPGMDGPEVLETLNRIDHLKSVPKIFMTAKARPEEVDALLAMGAVGVIAKPFDPIQLSEQVRALWNQALANT